MLKSKFTLRAYLIPIISVAFISITTVILVKNLPIKIDKIRWIDIYMGVLFSFTLCWLILGELRTKMIIVTITSNQIEKKNYLGLNKSFRFKDFDGYEISILTSKGESFEYLYLVKNGEKIIKISQQYHKNYKELKNEISKYSNNLGHINFSFIDELKEIFK